MVKFQLPLTLLTALLSSTLAYSDQTPIETIAVAENGMHLLKSESRVLQCDAQPETGCLKLTDVKKLVVNLQKFSIAKTGRAWGSAKIFPTLISASGQSYPLIGTDPEKPIETLALADGEKISEAFEPVFLPQTILKCRDLELRLLVVDRQVLGKDKVLFDGMIHLQLSAALQSTVVEFNKDGIAGQLKISTSEAPLPQAKREYRRGVAQVYNPSTGEVETKSAHNRGVAGVYNPETKKIEWREHFKGGIAGVYNPETHQVEWKTEYLCGVAGVYNPNTKAVEWKTAYRAGMAGVYNPESKTVEWKSEFHGGVAGYFDQATKKVKWFSHRHTGMSIVVPGADVNTYSGNGFFGLDSSDL